MDQASNYQLLRSVGISKLRTLDLLPAIKRSVFSTEASVWSHSAPFRTWSYICEGLVFGCVVGRKGKLVPYFLYGPGTWFGDPVISRNRSMLEYVCLSKAQILQIPFEAAHDAFENEPEYSRFVARLLGWRGQRHEELLSLLRLESPALRVALSLAMLADDLVNSASHLRRPAANSPDHLEIPLNQSLLASMCGLSRGIFSVHANKLVEAGWCQVRYARITLVNLKAWEIFLDDHRSKGLGLGQFHTPVL
jgi:CRP/FNR family cyclic AMP-dependent transcriptional regulator